MKLALTGATGFVGSHVLDLALEQGHGVRALTRREQAPRAGVEWVRGDLDDREALARLVEGTDAVIHIAGVVGATSADAFERGNVAGTRHMVEASKQAAIPRFVHVSSLAAREPELSLYCGSKFRGEEAVKASALGWTVVRPPAVYGPRDTEMFELFRAAGKGLVPVPARGATSVIHVRDLARLLLDLAGSRPDRAIYEPDDGRPGGWAHRELGEAIVEAVGRKARVIGVSPGLLGLGARVDRLFRGDKAKLTPDRAAYIAHPNWVSREAARPPAALWQAEIATTAGLRQTAAWYREKGWL